jgi:hypothetical protein
MRRRSLVALTMLLAAVAVGGSAKSPSQIEPAERRLIIEQAYANLTRLAANGGATITFELGEMTTVERSQFAETVWLDLVTMPGGDMVDVTREESRYNAAFESVLYRPRWRLDAADYLATPEGLTLPGMTAEQVLEAVAAEQLEARGTEAISSWEVTVQLDGRARSYRAAALWLPPKGRRGATVFFLDHVTQGLEEAVRERHLAPRPRPPLERNKALSCQAAVSTKYLYLAAPPGKDGHVTGSHRSSGNVAFTCSCDSDCSAECTPDFESSYCDDFGVHLDSCHKMATNTNLDGVGSADGRSAPPACAAGQGCVKKSCLFCNCGLSVEVEVAGTTVKFTPSGQPDWQGNLTFKWTQCPACVEIPPPPPPPPPGGGSNEPPFNPDPDGGGSGGSGGGSMTRTPNGSGGFTCCYWGPQGQFLGCSPC